MDFKKFREDVKMRFAALQNIPNSKLYLVKLDGPEPTDDNPRPPHPLWEKYMEGFDSDELLAQEHRCSSCRRFIRRYGKVVAIKDGKKHTLWDFVPSDEAYAPIIKALHEMVLAAPIEDIFLDESDTCGTPSNSAKGADGKYITWTHLHGNLQRQYVINPRGASIASLQGSARETVQVFNRGLTEIKAHAIQTVQELIAQNSLYRGADYRDQLTKFQKEKTSFDALTTPEEKELFGWERGLQVSEAVARIKNTSIGKLLLDLSEGKELDHAVSAFELIVAPTNYKRPTALVTKSMIEAAQKKIEELGLTSALARRHATPQDIKVTIPLFVDRPKPATADIFAQLKGDVLENPKSFSKVDEIGIEDFIKNILPNANSIEVLFEEQHIPKLVSLIAPTDPDAPTMFKWGNAFSWSYMNDLTDSIKERVKAQGGSVTGVLRVSLAWYNPDDLDLSVQEPDGNIIYFGSRNNLRTGGELDVDMNF